ANLALGLEPAESIIAAKEYVTEALRNSLSIGHGN
ncbi:MAG: bifunctional hydroxymethylpyrimidine kinase/phosphomethylpyrimidine kinase, partial [Planctomycetaceae bacterium]|nr:bifunctional hydroxymethylpyrimidine kinase/phosphomethylpyrimidine kinase [Planctomycetaceae bacterium]